jgi:hypothetical protein
MSAKSIRKDLSMEKTLYLIGVHRGVEPFVQGPFKDENKRDVAAKSIHRKQKADDSLFWADVDQSGGLIIGSYVAGFFREEYADTDNMR